MLPHLQLSQAWPYSPTTWSLPLNSTSISSSPGQCWIHLTIPQTCSSSYSSYLEGSMIHPDSYLTSYIQLTTKSCWSDFFIISWTHPFCHFSLGPHLSDLIPTKSRLLNLGCMSNTIWYLFFHPTPFPDINCLTCDIFATELVLISPYTYTYIPYCFNRETCHCLYWPLGLKSNFPYSN